MTTWSRLGLHIYLALVFAYYFNMYLQVVNLQGKLKSSKRQASELHFDFSISCIVCLTDRWRKLHYDKINCLCILKMIDKVWPARFDWLIDVSFFRSVLAFHRQGMQGRSFKNNEVNSTTTINNIFSRQTMCSINLYYHQRWHKRSVIGREFSSLSDPTGWLSGSHSA